MSTHKNKKKNLVHNVCMSCNLLKMVGFFGPPSRCAGV